MHYSFPQKMVETVRAYMVDTVRSWPEYQKVVQMLREKVFDEDHIIELARELRNLFLRGIVFIDCKCNKLSPSFVLT
jgi:hypothetical protein